MNTNNKREFGDAIILKFISLKFNLDPFSIVASLIIVNG